LRRLEVPDGEHVRSPFALSAIGVGTGGTVLAPFGTTADRSAETSSSDVSFALRWNSGRGPGKSVSSRGQRRGLIAGLRITEERRLDRGCSTSRPNGIRVVAERPHVSRGTRLHTKGARSAEGDLRARPSERFEAAQRNPPRIAGQAVDGELPRVGASGWGGCRSADQRHTGAGRGRVDDETLAAGSTRGGGGARAVSLTGVALRGLRDPGVAEGGAGPWRGARFGDFKVRGRRWKEIRRLTGTATYVRSVRGSSRFPARGGIARPRRPRPKGAGCDLSVPGWGSRRQTGARPLRGGSRDPDRTPMWLGAPQLFRQRGGERGDLRWLNLRRKMPFVAPDLELRPRKSVPKKKLTLVLVSQV